MSIKDTERVAGQIMAIHRAEFGRLSDIIAAKDAEIARLREGLYRMGKESNYSGDGKFIVWDDGRPVKWIHPAEFARKLLEEKP
jgi:hypothetical protein